MSFDPIFYLGSCSTVRSYVRSFVRSLARSLARSRVCSHGSQDESIVLSEPPTNRYLPSSGFFA